MAGTGQAAPATIRRCRPYVPAQRDRSRAGRYVRGYGVRPGSVSRRVVRRVSDADHEAPKGRATTDGDAVAVPDKPSRAHRLVHIVGAVLVAVVLPAVLMGALVGSLGVSALFIGLLLGVVGSKIGGTRRMLFVAPVVGVAAGLGAFTAYDWWWVALLAAYGRHCRRRDPLRVVAAASDASVRRHVRRPRCPPVRTR